MNLRAWWRRLWLLESDRRLPPSRGQYPRPPQPRTPPPMNVPLSRPAHKAATIERDGLVFGNPGDPRCWLCGATDRPSTWTLDGYICDPPRGCRSKEERDAAGWVGG